jgi:hypothetical protein
MAKGIALLLWAKSRIKTRRILLASNFLFELGNGGFDKIMAYGALCECIKDLEDEDLTSEHNAWIFLLMSLDIKVHSESLTRTTTDLSITSSCFGMMVLNLMNRLKWSLNMTCYPCFLCPPS